MSGAILTDSSNIGLAQLQSAYPTLDGAGVTVGQAEADVSANQFEVDPGTLGTLDNASNSTGFLTYYGDVAGVQESTTLYNDGLIGAYSSHATSVAAQFYGPGGVAPGVSHVDNYNAQYYAPNFLATDKVVNMSYAQSPSGTTTQASIDSSYDAVALADNMVLVASAGNSGSPSSPSTAYNVISVGNSLSLDAVGPAYDGAAKPDISAPGSATSFTAPQVAGAAAVLVQAASGGWQGATAQSQSDAADFRTIKTLLLNGATKPSDYFTGAYAPTATNPLNARYGAGVLNVYNSVNELHGGEHAANATWSVAAGSVGFQAVGGTALPTLQGWNFATLTAQRGQDEVNGYKVDLTAGQVFIATISWASNASNAINHFGLYLYDDTTGQLLVQSTATASNVEQVYLDPTTTGTYDLQVALDGKTSGAITDTYALAYSGATVACFCAGTAILTERGEVAVEDLAAGDRVISADGRAMPVRWLGVQTVTRAAADPLAVQPIRIRAGALGDNLPRRDLLVSPGHALLFGEVLVQAGALVNGTTIARVAEMPAVWRYHHVELDTHALLLAEGVPAESYLATTDPAVFDNTDARPARAMPAELPYPRAKAPRQVPPTIAARLARHAGTPPAPT